MCELQACQVLIDAVLEPSQEPHIPHTEGHWQGCSNRHSPGLLFSTHTLEEETPSRYVRKLPVVWLGSMCMLLGLS